MIKFFRWRGLNYFGSLLQLFYYSDFVAGVDTELEYWSEGRLDRDENTITLYLDKLKIFGK